MYEIISIWIIDDMYDMKVIILYYIQAAMKNELNVYGFLKHIRTQGYIIFKYWIYSDCC